jgi:acetylglutamate kinase
LEIADDRSLAGDLRAAVRAAALGVRAGVGAAQICDGRVAHAAIVEFLTARHLGTQVAGTVFTG